MSNLLSGATGGYTGSYLFCQTIFTLRNTRSRVAGFVLILGEVPERRALSGGLASLCVLGALFWIPCESANSMQSRASGLRIAMHSPG